MGIAAAIRLHENRYPRAALPAPLLRDVVRYC
jgi:hypothetical protein